MRMPRKKKVFRKFIFGDGAKILRYRNSVWLNNQAFLMQYNVAKNLWLKLRYIRYQSGTLKFLFWTWHHHYHHLHHHNHHDDQEKHNIMYKKSRANGSQAGGLPDCTEVTDWPRTTFEISLILPSHSHLRKKRLWYFCHFASSLALVPIFAIFFLLTSWKLSAARSAHTRGTGDPLRPGKGENYPKWKSPSTSNTKSTCCPKGNLHRTM